MKVVIVGAGAVGSILAAKLVLGGLDVVCVARGRRAAQVRDVGLRIEGLERLKTQVQVVEHAANIANADVLLIATKSYDTQAALARLETHRMVRDPDLARIGVLLYKEMGQLAEKLGIPLEDHGAMARLQTILRLGVEEAVADLQQSGAALAARGATGHKVSTLQDIEYGRRLEIDEIMGYAVRRACEVGLQLTTVEVCYRMVAGLDRALRAERKNTSTLG